MMRYLTMRILMVRTLLMTSAELEGR